MAADHSHEVKSFSDMVFGFLDDGEGLAESCISDDASQEYEDQNEEKPNDSNLEEDKRFWENQRQLLQATLCRSSSLESRIRNQTKQTLNEIQKNGNSGVCGCGRAVGGGCRNCLMREVSGRLRNLGYNSAVCTSKWSSSPDIPSGEHTFLDVTDNASSKREVRVIIELNFRAEFEIARATDEYNRLVCLLPEVFVGKVERLENVIKILCLSAKKCMKEKKMHMGPWRKQRYMQAKWLGTCKRTTSVPILSMEHSVRVPKPRASMLSVNLLEKLPNIMHHTVVAVL